MVTLSEIQASNALVAKELPGKLIAVFVGGTSGIGEFTLRALARHAAEPRLYFIGRNAEAGKTIEEECRTINPKGQYIFMKADTGLLRNVDKVCAEIAAKEPALHLLFLSQGTLATAPITDEDLPLTMALTHYARARFIHNLLPLLERADALRRVVTVFAGGKDGAVVTEDLQGRKMRNPATARGHAASVVTLGIEHLAREHPTVSFIHGFPGFVKTKLGNTIPGILGILARAFFGVLMLFLAIPSEETGARHLYLATSAQYPAAEPTCPQGVCLGSGLTVARDISGSQGGGMYVIDEHDESAPSTVEKLVSSLKEDGTSDMVWQDLENQWERILGNNSAS